MKILHILKNLFTEHPTTVNETYLQHFKYAFFLSLRLIFVSFVLMIHAIFPFSFKTFASKRLIRIVKKIYTRHNHEFINEK